MIASHFPVAIGLLLIAAPLPAQQVGETVTKRGTLQEDQYLAGGTVDVRADVQGDLVVAGGQVLIAERVAQDVLAAGGTVDVGGDVLDDVRVAGGTVTLRGHIGGDAIAAGGTVLLEPTATVGGRAWFGGGDVRVAGRVATRLKASGDRVVISGVVEGDAQVVAQHLEILPSARITGSLTYRSPREAQIDPAAVIGGGVTRLPFNGPSRRARLLGRVVLIASLGALGTVLILLFPGFSQGVVGTLRGDPWLSVGLGFGVLVASPVVGILLVVTLVGAALGITGLVVYTLVILAGILAGARFVGELILGLLSSSPRGSLGGSIMALLLGLVILALLRWIPVLGGLACALALLFGLGALVLQAYRVWKTVQRPSYAAT